MDIKHIKRNQKLITTFTKTKYFCHERKLKQQLPTLKETQNSVKKTLNQCAYSNVYPKLIHIFPKKTNHTLCQVSSYRVSKAIIRWLKGKSRSINELSHQNDTAKSTETDHITH